MKRIFKISNYKISEIKEIISFLNSSAYNFYKGEYIFESYEFAAYFRSYIQGAMEKFERVIKNTFGCDIFLKNVDIEYLKELFPNMFNNIYKIDSNEDLVKAGRALETIRNINSHILLSDRDYFFFKNDYSYLENQPKMNDKIKYFDEGLTIGGLIFIICNLLREQSLKDLIKTNYIFSVIITGEYSKGTGDEFVKRISHVNLEKPIRKQKGSTIKDSIIGEYSKYISFNGDLFLLSIGSENHPIVNISGKLIGNRITIDKGSLNKVYYSQDFELEVVDELGFKVLSNSLPPFTLIDFLFSKNITKFDEKQFTEIKNSKVDISKLNYPKFYDNKNINILLLPNTASDFRLMSSVISGSLFNIFFFFVKYLYENYEVKTDKWGVSSIYFALLGIGIPKDIAMDISLLRNFASHGYIIDEVAIYEEEKKPIVRQYSKEYIIDTIHFFVEYIKENKKELYIFVKELLDSSFIKKVIRAKYKKVYEESNNFLDDYPNYDKEKLATTNGFINNSQLDINRTFLKLSKLINSKFRLIEVRIDGLDDHLYFPLNDKIEGKINQFAKHHNFKDEKKKNGLIIYYYLGK